MTARLRCCIRECQRSFRGRADDDPAGEVMCGRCWRTVDPELRGRYKTLRVRAKKCFRLMRLKKYQAKPDLVRHVDALHDMFVRADTAVWAAIKEDAEIKSGLRVEGTAGWVAAKRRRDIP